MPHSGRLSGKLILIIGRLVGHEQDEQTNLVVYNNSPTVFDKHYLLAITFFDKIKHILGTR